MSLPPARPEGTCLVTGASSGIGVDLARELAGRGYGVTLVARRRERLEKLATELRDEHKVRVEVLPADLTDPEARASLFTELDARGLVVDVLINNAGFSTIGAVAKTDRSRELAMIRTDVEAVVDLCTLAVPGMVARGQGAILNVASTAAFQPIPGQAGYAASKAFVLNYTWALDTELRGSGVRASSLCPGPTQTEFIEAAGLGGDALKSVPKAVWAQSAPVAKAGIDGLAASRPVVIPGALNRASALSAQITPRRFLMPALKRFYPALKA